LEARLQIEPANQPTRPAPIDLWFLVLTKLHESYYEFMDKFHAPMVEMLIGKPPNTLCQTTMQELQGGNKVDDWYLLKD